MISETIKLDREQIKKLIETRYSIEFKTFILSSKGVRGELK